MGAGQESGLRQLLLGRAGNPALPMSEHHGTERRRDEERRGRLESDEVIGEDDPRDAFDFAAVGAIRLDQPDSAGIDEAVADPEDEEGGEAEAEQDGSDALALESLDEGVRRVDAHHHEHEEKEHHHGAGVDDDLHHPEEGRPIRDVQDGEVDHREGDP